MRMGRSLDYRLERSEGVSKPELGIGFWMWCRDKRERNSSCLRKSSIVS